MAKITSAVTFTGKVGGLIGYKRNGKYFLRSVPGKVRQSKATKRAAKRFGAASRKGALIRSALATELDILCDGAHVNQLNKTILHAGRDNHAGLTGFRFNKHKRVRDFFSTELEFTPNGILHIPAQQICAKEGAVRMEVKLIGTRIDFTTGKVTGSDASAMYIDLEGAFTPFTGADMSIEVPGKGTLLVTVRVRLFFESGLSWAAGTMPRISLQCWMSNRRKPSHQKANPVKRRQAISRCQSSSCTATKTGNPTSNGNRPAPL